MNLVQAIADRRLRAVEVRHEYEWEYAGLRAWVCVCPEDEDGSRVYLVDAAKQICTCPDYQCQTDKETEDHGCKHLWALNDMLGIVIETEWDRQRREYQQNYRPVHTPDPTDPFRD